METLRNDIRRAAWLCLLLPIVLSGCFWSYISEEAAREFQSREGAFSVTVYPVHVVRGAAIDHDEDLARNLAAFLRQEGLAEPVLGNTAIEIPFKWEHNEAKMAQQSAMAFASKVREVGLQTEYALLVEILCDGTETHVVGVHFYLSDREGRLASGGLTNSAWEEFKEVQPRDRNGGYEVAIRMLEKAWERR
jgi:hypothetical protein